MTLCAGYNCQPCPLGAYLGSSKTQCKYCKSLEPNATSTEVWPGFELCKVGCGVQIKTGKERCRTCGGADQKRSFLNFLINDPHCKCNGCSECDEASWHKLLDANEKAIVAKHHCSRPLANKKNKFHHEAGLCAVCVVEFQ